MFEVTQLMKALEGRKRTLQETILIHQIPSLEYRFVPNPFALDFMISFRKIGMFRPFRATSGYLNFYRSFTLRYDLNALSGLPK